MEEKLLKIDRDFKDEIRNLEKLFPAYSVDTNGKCNPESHHYAILYI